jgi:hypothetical protein
MMRIALSLLLVMAAFATRARADAPPIMPVQGFITDAAGIAVVGAHDLRFRIYTTPTAGAPLYDESIADVDVAEGLFSVELGNNTPLSLDLFDVQSSLFLGITIDDDVELSPRIVLGTVPWAAFAANAGDAATLGGLAPEDFRQEGVPVPFSELSDVPADADTLGALTCANGQVPKRSGTAWICGNDIDTDTDTLGALTCANGQVPKRAGTAWVCGNDNDVDTDTLGGLTCIAGDIAFFDGVDWTCLQLAGTACAVGEVVTGFDSAGNIVCDPPTDETIRGLTCPANQFMRGVNADGTLVCATLDATVRTYINTNCFIYVGWADDCEAGCGTPQKMGRVNGDTNACTTSLGGASDDSTCNTQVDLVGALDIRTLGTNFNGDVDGNDKLFVGFHCE